FDATRPAAVASTGVTMYLTKDAVAATLRQVATFARGSTLAMTFILPADLAEPDVRPIHRAVEKSALASGTPFRSFFSPSEMLALARDAGFKKVGHVSTADLNQRYFRDRADGLRTGGEDFLVAST
ncbi:MAG: class I SAM-dependent methyltransferase, partial [Candidatus Acidiferrales bacterium]